MSYIVRVKGTARASCGTFRMATADISATSLNECREIEERVREEGVWRRTKTGRKRYHLRPERITSVEVVTADAANGGGA